MPADGASFIEPCLSSPADKPPSGSNWIHEIKHDGYRLMARQDPVRTPGVPVCLGPDGAERDGPAARANRVRKATLASMLRNSRPGVRLNEHMGHPEGAVVFQHACKMGLEGIVSKRKASRYRSGRSGDWLKSKNPACESGAARRGGNWSHR